MNKTRLGIFGAALFCLLSAVSAFADTNFNNMIYFVSGCTSYTFQTPPPVSGNAICVDTSTGAITYFNGTAFVGSTAQPFSTVVLNGSTSGALTLKAGASTTSYTMTFKSAVPAAGDILDYSNGTGTVSSLVDVAVGQVVVSGGVGAVPTYSASPTLSGTLTVQGATVTIGVPASASGSLVLSNATGSGTYTLAQAATTTTYTETTKAVVPAQGDILDYVDGAGTRGSLVDVAAGRVLISGGVGAVPTYSVSPSLTSIALTGTGDLAVNASQGGHISSQIGAGSIPTIGTGTISALSTDNAMQATGATSPATVTFHTPFAAQPVCTCDDKTSALGACKAVPNSNGQTVVVTTTGTDTFDMICIGH